MEQIWDPLRKKNVALTPEEGVRQWFIGILRDNACVPLHKMSDEVHLTIGEGSARKDFRADIVVWGRNHKAVAVVECKRPEVALDKDVVSQALRYNSVLDAPYIIVTNGNSTYIAKWQDGKAEFLPALPTYTDLCQQ